MNLGEYAIHTRAYAEQLRNGLKGLPDPIINLAKATLHFNFFMDSCGKALAQESKNNVAKNTALQMMNEKALEHATNATACYLRYLLDVNMVSREERIKRMPFLLMIITSLPFETAQKLFEEHGEEHCDDELCLLSIILPPKERQ